MNTNSVSDGQNQALCDSQLDFISYWADQTVEEAVLRGVELRQQKPQPLPSRDCDAVNIHFIKPPCIKKSYSGYRRKKSKKQHRSRSNSPYCREKSPSHSTKMSRRQKRCLKPKSKAPCAMRIAELAVPTKRQCLDTWRSKCNTLPAFMIERLRQHVLNQRPVVKISDAISCFKRKKSNKRKKSDIGTEKTMGNNCNYQMKKPLRVNDVKVLSAIFGHKIAKNLYKPVDIKLNSDLEKIANVVSCDITDLMCKSRNIDMTNKMNRLIHTDIIKKVTIWISGVLDESAYKMLEDQLKDFEEEAGPALDFIDELFDDVWDICKPEPDVCEDLSSSESDYLKEPEEGNRIEQFVLPEAYENIEEHLKNDILTIINNIDKDAATKSDEYLDVEDGPDWQSSEDAEAKEIDIKTDDYLESEKDVAFQLNGDEETKDTDIKANVNYLDSEKGVTLEPTEDAEIKDADIKTDDYLESEDGIALKLPDDAEIKETNIKTDDYLESEDGISLNAPEDAGIKEMDGKIDDYLKSEDSIASNPPVDAEIKETDIKIDDYLEPEDGITSNSNLPVDAEIKETDMKIDDYLESEDASNPPVDAEIKETDIMIDDYLESEDASNPPVDAEIKETDVKVDDYLESEDASNPPVGAEIKETDVKIDDYLESEDASNPPVDAEIKETDVKTDEYLESKDGIALQPTEGTEVKDTDIKYEEYLESNDGIGLQPTEGAEIKGTDIKADDYLKSEDAIALELTEGAEMKDTNANADDYLESDDGIALEPTENAILKEAEEQASVKAEIAPENIDDTTENFSDAIDDTKDEINPPDQLIDDATDVRSEGLSDDHNKKVTFTETVNDDENQEQTHHVIDDLDWKKSIDRMEFAAPNDDLLSDADELWPEETQPPIIRPSQSVSKSITSLGNISEVEEIASVLPNIPSDLEIRAEKDTTDIAIVEATYEHVDTEKDNIVDDKKLKQNTNMIASGTAEDSITSLPRKKKVSKKPKIAVKDTRSSKSRISAPKVIPDPSNQKKRRPSNKSQEIPPTFLKLISKTDQIVSKNKEKPPKTSKVKRDITKSTTKTTVTSENIEELDEILDVGKARDIEFSSVRVKPDYRVNIQTAPAWISRHFSEPTSCSCVNIVSKSKAKRTMNQNEIRQWCRDLQQGYKNIKVWNEWIDNSSRTVRLLKQEISNFEGSKICTNSEWANLKKNMAKDATLWKIFNCNTRERLRCYRKVYQKRTQANNIDCEKPK